MTADDYGSIFERLRKTVDEYEGWKKDAIKEAADKLFAAGMPPQMICAEITRELEGRVSSRYVEQCLPDQFKRPKMENPFRTSSDIHHNKDLEENTEPAPQPIETGREAAIAAIGGQSFEYIGDPNKEEEQQSETQLVKASQQIEKELQAAGLVAPATEYEEKRDNNNTDIKHLKQSIAEKDKEIQELKSLMSDQDKQIAELKEIVKYTSSLKASELPREEIKVIELDARQFFTDIFKHRDKILEIKLQGIEVVQVRPKQ